MGSTLPSWASPIAVLLVALAAETWHKLVSKIVPEPYLDEVFHIPQAQRYCNGDYTWDPKITTPPGLYFLSMLLKPFLGCGTSVLRALNAGAICLVCLQAYDILRKLHARGRRMTRASTFHDAHSAVNISLFPPLFFFSGLYYTDVISTLLVLVNYSLYLDRRAKGHLLPENLVAIVAGIAALSFRQTNIFWVAVFPAGLAVVDSLKRTSTRSLPAGDQNMTTILQRSWTHGFVYDCPIEAAGVQDSILFLITVAITAFRKLPVVIGAVVPYVVLLGLFSAFVVWNGGVVLGDKSNHVATIHFPQMAYIWPYIALFSFPLMLAPIFRLVAPFLPPGTPKAVLQAHLTGSAKGQWPNIISAMFLTSLGAAAVHFNTIVHPFTLADNRHYVFYIFRILRRHWVIKYLATPIYYITGWTAIQTLGSTYEEKEGDQRSKGSKPAVNEIDSQPCQISFVLIWLVTTALSVVTAPLVEPRYFIIPWIIWRLHVPSIAASPFSIRKARGYPYDMRLALETAWLLAINVVVGYNFLYRGFSWPSEPGNVQRFLW